MERGGLKSFARKGVGKMGGGGGIEIGVIMRFIIMRFLWRLLMMQHRKKSGCVYLSFVNKNVLQNNCLNTV